MGLVIEIIDTILQVVFLFIKLTIHWIAEMPISQMSLIKLLVDDTIIISSITWLNDGLLMIAGLIPTIVLGFLSTKLGLHIRKKETFGVLFFLYLLTVALFQSIVFWIVICGISVIALTLVIYANTHRGTFD